MQVYLLKLMGIGDDIVFNKGNRSYSLSDSNAVAENIFSTVKRDSSVDIDSILVAAKNYCQRLRTHYFLRLFYAASESDKPLEPQIIAHSEVLNSWFSDKFGTDSFVVGAHFEINHTNKITLKWQIVLGLLIDNELDLKSVLKMIFSARGIRFLCNKREEITGVLFSFRISAEYQD